MRTSHYPQAKSFLDRCDEIGLLVFEELPGWQFIGDESWKQLCYQNITDMIYRDYNHPSIIMWGVRINESLDDDDFYTKPTPWLMSLIPHGRLQVCAICAKARSWKMYMALMIIIWLLRENCAGLTIILILSASI